MTLGKMSNSSEKAEKMKNPPEKALLILDLDETLIHASEHELDGTADFCISEYFVYCRPHLLRFLQLRARVFELAIWSSGTASYVQEIVQRIIPDDVKLSFLWSRDRCGLRRDLETDETYYQKDLKKVTKLGYSLSKILILEDKKENVRRHFGNAVYIKPWYGDPSDVELEKIGPFMDYLSTVPNVRTIEKRNWTSYREPN